MAELTILHRAEHMLERCTSVSLASITGEGYPRICEMEKVLTAGLRHICFVTLKASEKVAHFRQNPRAGVGFCIGDDSVSLIGEVTILEDEAEKEALLPQAYQERLRRRDSTRYCVLRFETAAAKVFIEGVFETYTGHGLYAPEENLTDSCPI